MGTAIITGGDELLFGEPGDASALAGLYASVNWPASATTWTVTIVPPGTG